MNEPLAYRTAKRLLDLGLAGLGLAVASPVLAATALAIRLTMGGPVLFRQRRPGRNGVPFELLKFRTMRPPRPEEDEVKSDGDRMTAVGRLLRDYSLDELPTLINVMRGEMSLVGPRPLLMQYLERYTPEQARRHEVKPGVTGWAQINGRNAVSWEEKFDMDVWYVDHRSLSLDLRIIAQTILKVLGREGIAAEGQATTTEFMGSSPPGSDS